MSAGVEVITQTLKEHRAGIRTWQDGYRHSSCMCPEEVHADSDEYRAHVAEAVVAALNDTGLKLVDTEVLRTALNFGYGSAQTPAGANARAYLRSAVGVGEQPQ